MLISHHIEANLTPVTRWLCLVHYTGAFPAEFYSVKSRPGYKSYQSRVNMFMPGPRRE